MARHRVLVFFLAAQFYSDVISADENPHDTYRSDCLKCLQCQIPDKRVQVEMFNGNLFQFTKDNCPTKHSPEYEFLLQIEAMYRHSRRRLDVELFQSQKLYQLLYGPVNNGRFRNLLRLKDNPQLLYGQDPDSSNGETNSEPAPEPEDDSERKKRALKQEYQRRAKRAYYIPRYPIKKMPDIALKSMIYDKEISQPTTVYPESEFSKRTTVRPKIIYSKPIALPGFNTNAVLDPEGSAQQGSAPENAYINDTQTESNEEEDTSENSQNNNFTSHNDPKDVPCLAQCWSCSSASADVIENCGFTKLKRLFLEELYSGLFSPDSVSYMENAHILRTKSAGWAVSNRCPLKVELEAYKEKKEFPGEVEPWYPVWYYLEEEDAYGFQLYLRVTCQYTGRCRQIDSLRTFLMTTQRPDNITGHAYTPFFSFLNNTRFFHVEVPSHCKGVF